MARMVDVQRRPRLAPLHEHAFERLGVGAQHALQQAVALAGVEFAQAIERRAIQHGRAAGRAAHTEVRLGLCSRPTGQWAPAVRHGQLEQGLHDVRHDGD
jgi:hypothetical protein